MLDLALAAHGRDHVYRVERWCAGAVTTAAAAAAFLDRDPDDERYPMPVALDRGARGIADTLVALPRDRIVVPATWREAAGALLVVYATAAA